MTTVRAQFNASTLKASYTAGTSKQQAFDTEEKLAGDVCQWCDTDATPKYVTVTFTGLTTCPCNNFNGGSRKYTNVAENINNVIFHLLHSSFLPGGADNCIWGWNPFAHACGTQETWSIANCAGAPDDTVVMTNLLLRVGRIGVGQVGCIVDGYTGGFVCEIFDFDGVPTTLSGCINTTFDSENVTCVFLNGAYGGTCTIQEGWK